MRIYERFVKRGIDILLSGLGLVVLCGLYGLTALAIFMDDPGPVIFIQKRIGKDKTTFDIHKFRSMKMDAPKDVPTHLMTDFARYTTRVGRFIRRSSIDELPQLWDIFRGKMSIVGPRPALWNQDDLIEERDRYLANDIKPGLTGWAQINGRDELDIPVKAQMDGYYAEKLKAGGLKAFIFDCKCFFLTIHKVITGNGIQEKG